jgi:hypothetical protein
VVVQATLTRLSSGFINAMSISVLTALNTRDVADGIKVRHGDALCRFTVFRPDIHSSGLLCRIGNNGEVSPKADGKDISSKGTKHMHV